MSAFTESLPVEQHVGVGAVPPDADQILLGVPGGEIRTGQGLEPRYEFVREWGRQLFDLGMTSSFLPMSLPAIVNGGRSSVGLLHASSHDDDARTEEHREDGHHLHVGEEISGQPDQPVDPGNFAQNVRVISGLPDRSENADVHDQDAE